MLIEITAHSSYKFFFFINKGNFISKRKYKITKSSKIIGWENVTVILQVIAVSKIGGTICD